MKFEDLIEKGHKRTQVSLDPYYGKPDDYYSSDPPYKQNTIQQLILNKLKNTPALKVIMIPLAIVIIIAFIIAIVTFFPQIIRLLEFIYDNGLTGVIDYIINSIK
jgi:hypothetical protein